MWLDPSNPSPVTRKFGQLPQELIKHSCTVSQERVFRLRL